MSKDDIIEQMFKEVFSDAVSIVEVPYEPADDDDGLERQATPCDCVTCIFKKMIEDVEKLDDPRCPNPVFLCTFNDATVHANLLKLRLQSMQEIHDKHDDDIEKAGMFDAIDQLKETIGEFAHRSTYVEYLEDQLKTHQEALKDSTDTGVLLAKKLKELEDENKDLKEKLAGESND